MDNTILNGLPDPIMVLNERREVIDANNAAQDLLSQDYKNRDLAISLRHPVLLQAVDAVLAGGRCGETEVELNQPLPRNFEINISRLSDEGVGTTLLLVLHDVTAARKAESFRKDFIANVSHELRSPLVSLVGFIETLQSTASDDEEARTRFLSIMAKEGARMKSLIDDLLSLSKVEANEHVRPEGLVDVVVLLKAIAEPLSHKAEKRDIKIKIEAEAALPDIPGERDELVNVFTNLLDNAIKYGAQGSTITVDIQAVERIPDVGGAGIAIAVHNEGEGMAPEHIPRLTERFYRIDKGRSRSMGGTGLGLAIVKHIVNHHRGGLAVKSRLGEGSTFTVFLPTKT